MTTNSRHEKFMNLRTQMAIYFGYAVSVCAIMILLDLTRPVGF